MRAVFQGSHASLHTAHVQPGFYAIPSMHVIVLLFAGTDSLAGDRLGVFNPSAPTLTSSTTASPFLTAGTDSLAGDRLGVFNLSSDGHAACVSHMMSYGVPLMLLGGGGGWLPAVSQYRGCPWLHERSSGACAFELHAFPTEFCAIPCPCCRLQDHQCGALLGPRDRCAAVRAGTVLDRHARMFERLGDTNLQGSHRAVGALAALLHLPRLPAISVCTHAFSAFFHWPPQAWLWAPTWRSSCRPTSITTTMPQARLWGLDILLGY